MNRDELIASLEACRDAIRAEGATALYICGSRGDHRPDNDLDVLVEYDPACRFSLLDRN
jgi:predicted nucleotidyltransferase